MISLSLPPLSVSVSVSLCLSLSLSLSLSGQRLINHEFGIGPYLLFGLWAVDDVFAN